MIIKNLVIGFLLICLLGYSVATNFSYTATTSLNGKILYVGGSGPNNYTSIQDAIDDAKDGDTIFVYSGTYYENIVIYKELTIKGEDKNTTIIDGKLSGTVVSIHYVNYVELSGFTIKNGGDYVGVYLTNSRYCKIYDCKITSSDHGMVIYESSNNEITDCYFHNNYGHNLLITVSSNNNKVKDCVLSDAKWGGIYIYESNSNFIENCVSENCATGFVIGWDSKDNSIINCSSSKHDYNGIFVYNADNTEITNCHLFQNNVDGIRIRAASSNIKVEGCIMENNWAGIEILQESSSIQIKNNNIVNNEIGVYVNGSKNSIRINYNNIFGNNGKGVIATNDSIVDARNNYWGTFFGPITFGLLGDGVIPIGGKIYFFPWSFKPFS